jgi:membrane protease YdiL (CAAX protease family)
MVCGFVAAFSVGIASNLIHTPETSNPMTDLMQGRTALIVMAVFGITLGPLFEELAFRGFLQPLLVRSVGAVGGVLLAAIPFGLLHYQEYGNSWRHALVISLAGASFGAMRQATGSTRAAALMHGAYNAFFFVVLFARKGQP